MMRVLRALLLIAPLVLLGTTAAMADDVISGSGTWGATAPTTIYSAPGETWSFSFDISDPVTDATLGGPGGTGFLTMQFTDFTYSLNGTAVTTTVPTGIVFFAPAQNGLFDIDFSDGNNVSFYGSQVFAGSPPPDMTFIDGVYSATSAITDAAAAEGSVGTVTIAAITSAPEPASLSLLGLGFGMIAILRRSTRKQA